MTSSYILLLTCYEVMTLSVGFRNRPGPPEMQFRSLGLQVKRLVHKQQGIRIPSARSEELGPTGQLLHL